MLSQLWAQWPLVIIAQALGVAVAWSVDEISWELRRDENKVYAFNLVSFFATGFFAIVLLLSGVSLLFLVELLTPLLLWLFLLTYVQAKQLKTPPRDTFFGLLAQLLCFLGASLGSLLFAVPIYAVCNAIIATRVSLGFGFFASVWVGSGALVYAVLSLFRPTIHATWQTYRQNSAKT